MQDVSPPGDRHPQVEITEGDGCPGCLFKMALKYLLQHGTGTGRLTLNADELDELGEPNLILLVLRMKDDTNDV